MKYFASYVLCTLSVYLPSNILISTLQIDRNPNIDDLIEKLLKSDKFDELASKIADKAVEKIKDMQNRSKTTNNKVKNEVSYRNSGEKNSTQQLFPKSMFEDDFVKSIINRDSFDNLSLKYVKFVKNKSNNNISAQDSLSIENSIANISSEVNSNKKKKRKGDKKKKIERIKASKEEKSITDSDETEEKEKRGNKKPIKKIKENIENLKENDPIVESEQIINNESDEINNNDTAVITESKDTVDVKLSEENKYDESADMATLGSKYSTKSNKEKKVLRKENDRVYLLESSSEYDGYKDKIYDALED